MTFLVCVGIFRIYNSLGPGLFETSYEAALAYELTKSGLNVERQFPLPLVYEEIRLEVGYRVDLLVEKKVIIELKSVESLTEVQFKQLVIYLRLSKLKVGILVNFNTMDLVKSIHSRVNNF